MQGTPRRSDQSEHKVYVKEWELIQLQRQQGCHGSLCISCPGPATLSCGRWEQGAGGNVVRLASRGTTLKVRCHVGWWSTDLNAGDKGTSQDAFGSLKHKALSLTGWVYQETYYPTELQALRWQAADVVDSVAQKCNHGPRFHPVCTAPFSVLGSDCRLPFLSFTRRLEQFLQWCMDTAKPRHRRELFTFWSLS